MAASQPSGSSVAGVRVGSGPGRRWSGVAENGRCLGRPREAVILFPRAANGRPPRSKGACVSDWKELESGLNLKFKDATLLKQALVHTSYLNENPGIDTGSNERLEFLGDAVLGVVVAHELYEDYGDADEGKLTELRAHLVRKDTLARASSRFNLGEYLQLGRGEDAAGGRRRPTNLAGAYEALVGAIFLDGGMARARTFVRKSLAVEFAGLRERGMPHDPKSRLQEIAQSRWQTTPTYRLLKSEGPDHARRFTVEVLTSGRVLAVGEGRSKQMAEKDAARQALKVVEQEDAP